MLPLSILVLIQSQARVASQARVVSHARQRSIVRDQRHMRHMDQRHIWRRRFHMPGLDLLIIGFGMLVGNWMMNPFKSAK
jgi:hypothetical protein